MLACAIGLAAYLSACLFALSPGGYLSARESPPLSWDTRFHHFMCATGLAAYLSAILSTFPKSDPRSGDFVPKGLRGAGWPPSVLVLWAAFRRPAWHIGIASRLATRSLSAAAMFEPRPARLPYAFGSGRALRSTGPHLETCASQRRRADRITPWGCSVRRVQVTMCCVSKSVSRRTFPQAPQSPAPRADGLQLASSSNEGWGIVR